MGRFNSRQRRILYNNCKGVCPECGRHMSLTNPRAINSYMTVDHIVPLSLGGTSNLGNLRGLCRACNNERKSNMVGVTYKIDKNWNYVSKIRKG